jgi:predicted unusual protein kinase regulating ubiquinone biosynthesis (AarF/ABC1/UbiB family)
MADQEDFTRFGSVLGVLQRHGLGDVLIEAGLKRYLPVGERWPEDGSQNERQRAESLKDALEELGGTFIPVAQFLSTRPDVLPVPYLEALARVHHKEKPFPFNQLKEILESEWAVSLSDRLEQIDEEPLADSALAQTHRGRLRSAPSVSGFIEVEVKILKPGIERRIEEDVLLLHKAAELLSRGSKRSRIDFPRLAAEIEVSLRSSLDLRTEGRNAERLRRTLAEFGHLRVPRIVEEWTTRRVLVIEHIPGESFAPTHPPPPNRDLAEELWRGFLKQILEDGAFVYRLEPDNLTVDQRGMVVLKDVSSLAFLSREKQLRLIVLVLALLERDGSRVSSACVEIGVVGAAFRESAFRDEISAVIARQAGRPLGETALELAVISKRHDIRFPSELALVGRVLQFLESACRRLEPGMDPLAVARDVASSVLSEEISREFGTERMLATALELKSFLSEVPANLRRIVSRTSSNDLRVGVQIHESEAMARSMRKVADRITLGLVTAALIVSSALLVNADAGPKLWGYPIFAVAGFLLAAGLGVYVVAKTIISLKRSEE